MSQITSFILFILVNIYQVVGDLGLSIIIFTFLVRFLLYPLSIKTLKSQKEMKKLQPKMKELEKKHKNSPEKLNQARLELYQKYNVNPLAGCLPQLVQLGLLIVLYRVLINFFQHPEIMGVQVNTDFLWMNLSQPDPKYVLPVLAGLAQLFMALMISPGGETPDLVPNKSKSKKVQKENEKEENVAEMAAMMQKQMIFFMPAMTVFVALKFPSGVALYWIATTVFSVGQQYFVSGPGGLVTYYQRLKSLIRKINMQIQDYLTRLLEHAGVSETQISVEENDESIMLQLDVDEQDVGMLIGYHGETLASIQRIIRIVFKDEIEKRISLNINDYKEKREEKLETLANNYATRALETGEDQVLPFLPANERFIVHSVIGDNKEFKDLITESDGQGRNRRLVIKVRN